MLPTIIALPAYILDRGYVKQGDAYNMHTVPGDTLLVTSPHQQSGLQFQSTTAPLVPPFGDGTKIGLMNSAGSCEPRVVSVI